MQWWMYVLILAGLIVVLNVLLILWLGIATRETTEDHRSVPQEGKW